MKHFLAIGGLQAHSRVADVDVDAIRDGVSFESDLCVLGRELKRILQQVTDCGGKEVAIGIDGQRGINLRDATRIF